MNEIKRQSKFQLRYEMYNDNYDTQVINKLGQIYSAFAELKLDVQLHTNTNLYKQIINTISNVYSYGVEREMDDDAKELYAELRVDKTMTQANRYLNAFNDVIVQVSWDSNKEEPKLIVRVPHKTEIEYEDGEVKAVKYFVKRINDQKEQWAYWSDEEHYYIERSEGEEKITPLEDNPEMVNPFGRLPFVFMHNGWRDENFFDTYTGDDLVNGTLDLSIHRTFLNHIIKSQSFKQLVGKGDRIDGLNGQMLDPLSILTLTGDNTEISVLDMQSNYDQLHKVILELGNELAVNYGVSPSQFRMTSAVSSGFALQMENIKLDRFIKEQQQDFRVYEKELFNLLVMVGEYYNKPIKGEFSIDFKEPNYPTDKTTQITRDKDMIDLGLTSPAEILQRENPDLEDAEALAKVSSNLSARNEMLKKVGTSGMISQTETRAKLGLNGQG